MNVSAILCDAASVREGLLFVLGGGITRVWRDSFPARFDGAVALLVAVSAPEATDKHELRVTVSDEDGRRLAELTGQFEVSPRAGHTPGENLLIPLAVDLSLQIAAPGRFAIDVLIDKQLHQSLAFQARPAQERSV